MASDQLQHLELFLNFFSNMFLQKSSNNPRPILKNVVFFCEVCQRMTEVKPLLKFPLRGIKCFDVCQRCGFCFYVPLMLSEFSQFRQNSLELRSGRFIQKLLPWEMLGRNKETFAFGEPLASIEIKINLKIAREREISEEERATCSICYEQKDEMVSFYCIQSSISFREQHHVSTTCVSIATVRR
jgi:hypothetical protein